MKNSITFENQQMELGEFCDQFERADIEPTRGELLDVLSQLKNSNPDFVPALLGMVKSKYHISMVF